MLLTPVELDIAKGRIGFQFFGAGGIKKTEIVNMSLPKAKRKVPGYSTPCQYYLSAQVAAVSDQPDAQILLGLFEKALVAFLCQGDYTKLTELAYLDVLRAFQGPTLAAECLDHD